MTQPDSRHQVADLLDIHVAALGDAGHLSHRSDWPRCQSLVHALTAHLRAGTPTADLEPLPQPTAALMARTLAGMIAATDEDDHDSFIAVLTAYVAYSNQARGSQPSLLYDNDAAGVPYLPAAGPIAALRTSGSPVHVPDFARNAALLAIGDAYLEAAHMVASTAPLADGAFAPTSAALLMQFSVEAAITHAAAGTTPDKVSEVYEPVAAAEARVLHDVMDALPAASDQPAAQAIVHALLHHASVPDLYRRDLSGVASLANTCEALAASYSEMSSSDDDWLLAVYSADYLAEHFRSVSLDLAAAHPRYHCPARPRRQPRRPPRLSRCGSRAVPSPLMTHPSSAGFS